MVTSLLPPKGKKELRCVLEIILRRKLSEGDEEKGGGRIPPAIDDNSSIGHRRPNM